LHSSTPLIAVTPGDPAGIGPEILLHAVGQESLPELVAVADPDLLRQTARMLYSTIPIQPWVPGEPLQPGTLPCYCVRLARKVRPGSPDSANGPYVLDTLRQAVTLVQNGHAQALVTGPVNKAVISESGDHFSGHTEFLSQISGNVPVVMMLAAPGLRVTLVTTHLPLSAVADSISPELICQTVRITHQALRDQFGVPDPKLQVLGLNPHAGEDGHLGREDEDIVKPAIARCQEEGIQISGPVPADTAFTPPRLADCDAVVAMYHDQGLPVLKHMGFGRSVNITLGLPFIRTSVDHGTAFDIAGTGTADCSSLVQAIRTAGDLCSGSETGQVGRDSSVSLRE
jgi:4-hydroxythreonine-4-phosphate dehydrogenase